LVYRDGEATASVAAVGIILGVHRLMSSGFVAVNIVGNSLATIVIAGREGELDRAALKAGLEAGST
jgi:aerobic C4-dicarboxylate transport protein